MTDRELQEMIWKYVAGKLSVAETDRLFVEILKAPEWMDYLETLELFYQLHKILASPSRGAGKISTGWNL